MEPTDAPPLTGADHHDGRDEERAPIDSATSKKVAEILDACKWRDIGRLRALAESEGGLLRDDLRREAWPVLVGVSANATEGDDDDELKNQQYDGAAEKPTIQPWQALTPHRDESQVQLDVDRAFIYYPNNQSDAELKESKAELSSLIVEVLRRYPFLCYFQGYHDICQVFMLVLDPPWRARVVSRLSVLRIRDFMLPSLSPTTAQLRLLPDILDKADPKLWRHMAGIEPFYALSGTLTMFAHNIEAYHDISRLFDILLAREPVFSIYMFAQIVMDRRDELLDIDELDMLHVILGKVPANMDIDALIAASCHLYNSYPPEMLHSWRRISNASALKTVRDVVDCAHQSMGEGYEYFQKQVKELEWIEWQDKAKLALWRYRRPARRVGTALAVAALALYLRRHPGIVGYIASLFRR